MITLAPTISLNEILTNVQNVIAPLWPLKDYVAVNPFVGLTQHRFLSAKEKLDRVRDADVLMPLEYFQKQFSAGAFTIEDIESALTQCRAEYSAYYDEFTITTILQGIRENQNAAKASVSNSPDQRKYRTFAELIDGQHGTSFASLITGEISRNVAAHYDEGQAAWASPWKDLPLFEAWREAAMIDRRPEKLGIAGFREFATLLPSSPQQAIERQLHDLEIPPEHWCEYLQCQLLTIPGWAGYVKYRVREVNMAGMSDDDLIGLLAIRLAYDAALLNAYPNLDIALCWPSSESELLGEDASFDEAQGPSDDTLIRYALQVATETAYRRRLAADLIDRPTPERLSKAPAESHQETEQSLPALETSKSVQMVFCIDVRSELIRRNLEVVSDEIETFGFAGFFAMAMEYVPLGETNGSAQCPVLLSPGFQVREGLRGRDGQSQANAVARRRMTRAGRGVWKSFQSSASSCFSFVESLGFLYAGKLISNTFRFTRPVAKSHFDGIKQADRGALGPVLHHCGHMGITDTKRVDLAEGMLRNLGLTENFARLVVVCGHGSETANNPYKAGLDCGACGGHAGESNARVAASILNDHSVREALQERGITIPAATWFLAAQHNTTTDEIEFFDVAEMPASMSEALNELGYWTRDACELTRAERALRMRGNDGPRVDERDLIARSRDWSEVRPEWGLAGNAAFVVAPRSRTANLKLDGRTFLHSYDFRNDKELKVLELIMTAPMVVTNWINLQYYASTVDNQHYGSGNKAIHNVVGQLGVVLGNGGDLMSGLPWQSIHDGSAYQHEPLRLMVVIEAPRKAIQTILDKHPFVDGLASNGWLTLSAIENEVVFQYFGELGWKVM